MREMYKNPAPGTSGLGESGMAAIQRYEPVHRTDTARRMGGAVCGIKIRDWRSLRKAPMLGRGRTTEWAVQQGEVGAGSGHRSARHFPAPTVLITRRPASSRRVRQSKPYRSALPWAPPAARRSREGRRPRTVRPVHQAYGPPPRGVTAPPATAGRTFPTGHRSLITRLRITTHRITTHRLLTRQPCEQPGRRPPGPGTGPDPAGPGAAPTLTDRQLTFWRTSP